MIFTVEGCPMHYRLFLYHPCLPHQQLVIPPHSVTTQNVSKHGQCLNEIEERGGAEPPSMESHCLDALVPCALLGLLLTSDRSIQASLPTLPLYGIYKSKNVSGDSVSSKV